MLCIIEPILLFSSEHILVVEIDEKEHVDRDPDYEMKRQKELEKLGYHLFIIKINPDKPGFDDYEQFGRVSAYTTESIKKETKKQPKRSLIDDLSKRLLELEFKQYNAIKSKCLKWIVESILPNYKK